MINKNKEQIEMIEELIGHNLKHGFQRGSQVNMLLDIELEATIKTSIDWCEDEIEFLDKILKTPMEPCKESILILKGINELQTHLTWLKEQEKRL